MPASALLYKLAPLFFENVYYILRYERTHSRALKGPRVPNIDPELQIHILNGNALNFRYRQQFCVG